MRQVFCFIVRHLAGNFPRNVMIMANGRLNKPATQVV